MAGVPTAAECSICRKDGVYDRHERKMLCHQSYAYDGMPEILNRSPIPSIVDLCPVSVDDALVGRRLSYDITVDSGAGKSVMNPDAIPEYPVQESPGQAQGQYFFGAGGERLPNL